VEVEVKVGFEVTSFIVIMQKCIFQCNSSINVGDTFEESECGGVWIRQQERCNLGLLFFFQYPFSCFEILVCFVLSNAVNVCSLYYLMKLA
jgi:hypothetical protein